MRCEYAVHLPTHLTRVRAANFEVSLAFLLQQAAWLYERQLLQVRAQMRKVTVLKGSSAPSPIPGSTELAGEAMRRTGSGGGGESTTQSKAHNSLRVGPRITSGISSRKDSPIPKNDTPLISGRPTGNACPQHPRSILTSAAPPFSRNSSANTTITSRNFVTQPQTSPRLAHAAPNCRSLSPKPKPRPSPLSPPNRSPLQGKLSSPETSSDDSSSESEAPAQSRVFRRPRFANKLGQSEDGDEDEDGPAFMPFVGQETHHDISATLRGDPRNIGRRAPSHRKSMEVALQQSQTSDSSASSTPAGPLRGVPRRPTGPLSPKRTAELVGRSPGIKGRSGSDGTPSMGSSFSDLDGMSMFRL